jgi:hypothetical protein
VKGREPHAFLAHWDTPIRVCPIQLQKVFAMRQLLDFVDSKRDGACIRLDALVDQGVNAHTESMIWVILGLPWR